MVSFWPILREHAVAAVQKWPSRRPGLHKACFFLAFELQRASTHDVSPLITVVHYFVSVSSCILLDIRL